MADCIFCKIATGDLPNYTIYEDSHFMAFLDMYPRVKGHTLVIPKKHYRWVYNVPHFGAYWEVAKKVTNAMNKTMSPEFVTYVTHGLEVPHAHIHVLPRGKGETSFVPEQKKFTEDEMKQTAKSIQNAIV